MTASRYSLPPHINERLRQLSVLPNGTDDENQPPPTLWAQAAAVDALTTLAPAAPQALDTVFIAASAGGVTLEWGTDDDRQLIVIVPPEQGRPFSIFRYSLEPRLEEDLLAEDLAGLPDLLSWLTNGDGVRERQLINVSEEETRWDAQLSAAWDTLTRLADQALADERAGRTVPLDLDDR